MELSTAIIKLKYCSLTPFKKHQGLYACFASSENKKTIVSSATALSTVFIPWLEVRFDEEINTHFTICTC